MCNQEIRLTVDIVDYCTCRTDGATILLCSGFVETDDVDRAIGINFKESPSITKDHGISSPVRGTKMFIGSHSSIYVGKRLGREIDGSDIPGMCITGIMWDMGQ